MACSLAGVMGAVTAPSSVRFFGMRMPETNVDSSVLAEINITPFTDVLLVLLIIFMILAALVVPPGFERTLGSPAAAPALKVAHAVPLVIDSHQRMRLDGVPITQAGLYGAMGRLAARNPNVRIALYADARARYQLVMRVLDAAKLAGIRDVSFVTQ